MFGQYSIGNSFLKIYFVLEWWFCYICELGLLLSELVGMTDGLGTGYCWIPLRKIMNIIIPYFICILVNGAISTESMSTQECIGDTHLDPSGLVLVGSIYLLLTEDIAVEVMTHQIVVVSQPDGV